MPKYLIEMYKGLPVGEPDKTVELTADCLWSAETKGTKAADKVGLRTVVVNRAK